MARMAAANALGEPKPMELSQRILVGLLLEPSKDPVPTADTYQLYMKAQALNLTLNPPTRLIRNPAFPRADTTIRLSIESDQGSLARPWPSNFQKSWAPV